MAQGTRRSRFGHKRLIMRKLIFAVIMLSIFKFADAQYVIADTVQLNISFKKLLETPDSYEAQKSFLNAFPNNWIGFFNTYCSTAYEAEIIPQGISNLNQNVASHLNALQDKLYLIDDSTYCDRLINLAVGATYRMDDEISGLLRDVMHRAVNGSRGDTMLRLASTLSTPDQLMFWQFYWSNTVDKSSGYKAFSELRTAMINAGYRHGAQLMSEAFANFWGKTSFARWFTVVGGEKYEGIRN